MSKIDNIMWPIVTGLAGLFIGGAFVAKHDTPIYEDRILQSQPAKVYFADLNNDGKEDIVVSQKNGTKYGFIQVIPGRYIPVEAYKQNKLNEIQAKSSVLETNVLNEFQELSERVRSVGK